MKKKSFFNSLPALCLPATFTTLFSILIFVIAIKSPSDKLAERIQSRDVASVWGGCNVAGTVDCQPTSQPNCGSSCNGKAVGDTCTGVSFIQLNPNFRAAVEGANGKKGVKSLNSTVLCNQVVSCGPACVNRQIGPHALVVCASSTAPSYEEESEPDGDDCDPVLGMDFLKPAQRVQKGLLASNGGYFNVFGVAVR